jgi:hypothetical protein
VNRQRQFKEAMALMKKQNPQLQEEGFHLLQPVAAEHLEDLIAAFQSEQDHGLRCWMLELIGAARASAALPLLAKELESPHEDLRASAIWGLRQLDTPDARRQLFASGAKHGERPSNKEMKLTKPRG